MADISKVRMLNGTEYNYKDAKARSDIEGLKADLANLNDNVDDLKSALEKNTENKLLKWSDSGYYINLNGSTVNINAPQTSQTPYRYIVDECSAGDIYTITGMGGTTARLYAFADASYNILNVAGSNVSLSNQTVVAPVSAKYLIVNTSASNSTVYKNLFVVEKIEVNKSGIGRYSGEMNISERLWEKGGLTVDGKNSNNNKYIRTRTYLSENVHKITIATGYSGYLVAWNSSGTCVGTWDGRQGYKTFNQQGQTFTEYIHDETRFPGYRYRIFIASTDASVTDLPLSAYTAVTMYNTNRLALDEIAKTNANVETVDDRVLKNVIADFNHQGLWEVGTIDTATGTINNSVTTVIRTKDYLPKEIVFAHTAYDCFIRVFAYTDAGVYVGSWNKINDTFDTTGSTVRNFDFEINANYKYKLALVRWQSGTVTLSDYYRCSLYNCLQNASDKTSINTAKLSEEFDCNKKSLWSQYGFNVETGYPVSWQTGKIRTDDYLPEYVSFVSTVDSDAAMYVFAYNENNEYAGTWNRTTCRFDTQGQPCREFDVSAVKKYHPGYRFRLMVASTGSSVDNYTNVKMCTALNRNYLLKNRRPILTFIDDDGNVEAATNWEGICKEANIEMDLALITSVIDTSGKLTSDEVKRRVNIGMEMISHTHNHINLNTETDPDVVRADFEATIQKLHDLYGTPQYLVYPFTFIADENKPLVREYFKCGISASVGTINTYNVSKTNIQRADINGSTKQDIEVGGETINVYPYKSLADLKELLDKANQTNGWIIFMSHLRNTVDSGYYYTSDIGDRIVSLCEYAREIGMEILPFSKGFNLWFDSFAPDI